ncbi:MAG: ATP-binding protein [Thermoanaerobaculia bacterium]
MIPDASIVSREMEGPWLTGGGESGALLRSFDWSKTPVGPIESWPASLKSAVGMVLHSRHPMFLWWGPELIQFYNDAYLPSFGVGKHPAAMGQRGRDCWDEIWPIIGPQIAGVMTQGQSSWNVDQLVPIFRNGCIEEVYWTYGYSPFFDDAGCVGGTLVVCTETTTRVLAERRLRTLSWVAEKTALAFEPEGIVRGAIATFEEDRADIPYALVITIDPSSGQQRTEMLGIDRDDAGRLSESIGVRRTGQPLEPLELSTAPLPGGPWPESATRAFAAPLLKSGTQVSRGFIVFGLSPRLPFDEAYRAFLRQLTELIALAYVRLDAFRLRAAIEGERTNLLLQAPLAAALLTGPQHTFRLANPLFCQLVGRETLVGKTYAEAFPELVGAALPAVLDRVFTTGEPFVTHEYPVSLDRSGSGTTQECFFRFNLQPIRGDSGEIFGMMATAVDITEQVSARRVLEQADREREMLLAELKAASEAKDEFLAMLGHELRNPLSPIVTALELMKLRGDPATSREQELISRQVGHLVRLVDDLLDISKITRGKVQLQREVIEVSNVLAKAVEIAGFLLEQRGHRLAIDVPRRGLLWEGDPIRLAQVVANLLTNAARYTDVGGSIRLSAFPKGAEIVISVLDDGIGISPELLPRIFDVFVQGKRSVDRAEGGLGIGLSLVKNLVAMHGGTVTARSDGPGLGSEFLIRLPAPSAEQLAAVPKAVPVPYFLNGAATPKRVLVVDDNDDAADALGEMLRLVGHTVGVAHDPATALSLLDALEPEVALLDIGLPEIDGYELAARIRGTASGARCQLIALTGYGQAYDRARSAEAGFAHHLVKPVNLETLMRIVAGELDPVPG